MSVTANKGSGAMARPQKKGLDYFPFDVDFFDDDKIIDLLTEYGPLGTTIYEVIISKVYKNGYYLEIPLDKLATRIIRIVGNRWIKNKDFVLQVIQYCGDIGLFHNALLSQSVITSVGIQRRYSEVTVRNKVDKSKYWLLDEKTKSQVAVVSAPENRVSVTETTVNTTETKINATSIQQKESKVNKSKVNKRRVVLQLPCTNGNYDVTSEQVELLRQVYKNIDVMESLLNLADFAHTNPSKQRPLAGAEIWIRKWLTKDSNGTYSNKPSSNQGDKPKTSKPSKSEDVSYDINVIEQYDIFE